MKSTPPGDQGEMSMSVCTCKLCGYTIKYKPGDTIAVCECCGEKMELTNSSVVPTDEGSTVSENAGAISDTERKASQKPFAKGKSKKKHIIITAAVTIAILAGLVTYALWFQSSNKRPKIGDTVLFGYDEDAFEWIVLDRKDDKLLLLSKYAIPCERYNSIYQTVTWSTCSLREWLNTSFLLRMFPPEKKEMIADTHITTENNPLYGSSGGDETVDKVFILSIEEALKYFPNNYDRIATFADGTYTWWWLRSTGYNSYYAAFVYGLDVISGSINEFGYLVNTDGGAVRPAIWVDSSAF